MPSMRRITHTDIQRFEAKLTKQEDGCWIWNGAKSDRYGSFYFPNYPQEYAKGMVSAHKAAYYLYKGEAIYLPEEVMHSCDNGFCCNPEHLSKGSHTDNMKDMADKGRRIQHNQVMSEQKVKEARNLRESGMQVIALAKIYNLSKSQMSRLVTGCQPKGLSLNRKKQGKKEDYETT